jgi:sulfatase maturation enzyme AslB (radical SAM superfamily)
MVNTDAIRTAIAHGQLGAQLFVLATFRCNLSCAYCLTESSSTCARRELTAAEVLAAAREAKELGFTSVAISGGEPTLLPWLPDVVAEIAADLPVLVLTNGLLLGGELLQRISQMWPGLPVTLQLSLDRPGRDDNDVWRNRGAFDRVVRTVPKLVERGLRVRIAATVHEQSEAEWQELRELARSLGVRPGDLFQRLVIQRGRAGAEGYGVPVGQHNLPPELTITADGAFWNPFGVTVSGGELDTDLLLTRTIAPLSEAAGVMLEWIRERPQGEDVVLGIR